MLPPLVGKVGSTGPTFSCGCTVMARRRTRKSPCAAAAGPAASTSATMAAAVFIMVIVFVPVVVMTALWRSVPRFSLIWLNKCLRVIAYR